MKPFIAMAASFAAQAPIQAIAVAAVMLTSPAITFAKPVVFSAAGQTPSSIQASVDAFRNFLGTNNGVGNSFPGGRREINWDGVPDAFAAPNNLPANFFKREFPAWRRVLHSGVWLPGERQCRRRANRVRQSPAQCVPVVQSLQSAAAVHYVEQHDRGDPLLRARYGPVGDH